MDLEKLNINLNEDDKVVMYANKDDFIHKITADMKCLVMEPEKELMEMADEIDAYENEYYEKYEEQLGAIEQFLKTVAEDPCYKELNSLLKKNKKFQQNLYDNVYNELVKRYDLKDNTYVGDTNGKKLVAELLYPYFYLNEEWVYQKPFSILSKKY